MDEGLEKFVMGLFQNQTLEVVTPDGRAHFTVQGVEMLPPPPFTDTMRFRATSPICISEQTDNDKQPQYLPPWHNHFEKLFFSNLENKCKAINPDYASPITQYALQILSEPRMKGLTTYKKNLDRPIKTIGYTFDFEVTAPVAWLRVGTAFSIR